MSRPDDGVVVVVVVVVGRHVRRGTQLWGGLRGAGLWLTETMQDHILEPRLTVVT
jgi:hypothetical protein